MKLSAASLYALYALTHLAGQKPGALMTAEWIAQVRGISEGYLVRALKPLVGIGVLHSNRGPNGGYCLARPIQNISLLEIIEAVDGPVRGDVSDVDGKTTKTPGLVRQLTTIYKGTADRTRKQLAEVSLASLMARK